MTSIKFRALTHDDHKLFFEALGEYGKDFQNIQQYMTQKGNKNKTEQNSNNNKSLDPQEKREQDKKEDDKKREQIRNFYNKLYTKLSQLVGKLDDRIEKVNQELYLLINYGEIWKKYGFIFNNKTKRLLEDLLYQGSTTLRFKNKNVRLRTPPCRALKKINQIGVDEKVKVVTTRELPKDVIVEFHPATNEDWLEVQSLSQNPRVRANLSIQKRLSNILEFLENKWSVSQEKLNRTVDSWLKLDSRSQQIAYTDDLSLIQSNHHANNLQVANGNQIIDNNHQILNNFSVTNCPSNINDSSRDFVNRLRLKPSAHHELKEVNITRVVPDNHLDLSLTAYINRHGETKSCCSIIGQSQQQQQSSSSSSKLNTSSENLMLENHVLHDVGSNSKLPVSLTTPDCSILFEKSCTSDQPSIAQARKHLNLLQSLTGALDGCENSRSACEDTQDRSLSSILNHIGSNFHGSTRAVGFTAGGDNSNHATSTNAPTILINNNIPALHDEDAALPVAPLRQPMTTVSEQANTEAGSSSQQQPSTVFESQNSKSVDFNLPKNVTLGDYFKMTNEKVDGGGTSRDVSVINTDETANDAFPTAPNHSDNVKADNSGEASAQSANQQESPKDSLATTQNHLVDIKRLAEGWTRLDDASMTIGELYLALKCPDKIILEYTFEKITIEDNKQSNASGCGNSEAVSKAIDRDHAGSAFSMKRFEERPSEDTLVFKLLTVASLSLMQIEREKHEQQLKLHDQQQSCSKFKRRKIGPGGHGHSNMTLHDIETTNQRVEEALKQLQPTRLCSYRRAR